MAIQGSYGQGFYEKCSKISLSYLAFGKITTNSICHKIFKSARLVLKKLTALRKTETSDDTSEN